MILILKIANILTILTKNDIDIDIVIGNINILIIIVTILSFVDIFFRAIISLEVVAYTRIYMLEKKIISYIIKNSQIPLKDPY